MDSGHNCQEEAKYSEEYDAFYCAPCNAWLESTCDDPTCEFCINRPKTPNEKND